MNTNSIVSIKSRAQRISVLVLFVLAVSLFTSVLPASAAAPGSGVVYEGKKVPGLALGATREEAYKAYGKPSSCSMVTPGLAELVCYFPVETGGTVSVTFKAISDSSTGSYMGDIVTKISWDSNVKYWKTTRGVTMELALKDRAAVARAYPNAKLTYDMKGQIVRMVDYSTGFQVEWFNSKIGPAVRMSIFAPATITGTRN